MSPRAPRLAWTAAGRTLLVLTLATALVGSLAPGPARPLAALGAATLAVAAALAWLPLRTLELDGLSPARGAVGARVRLYLRARHRARLLAPRRILVSIVDPEGGSKTPAGFVEAPHADGSPVELVWRPRRRGHAGPLHLAAAGEDPLGLVRCTRRFELAGERLGLPRRARLAHEPGPGRARAPAARGRRGRGAEELDHVRDWRAGESLRLLHWRLSARRGRPIVRELRAPAEPDVELLLCPTVPGLARRGRREAFERAVTLAATLAEHYLRAGRRLTLALPGGPRLAGLAGRAGLERALAWLALIEPHEGALDLDALGGRARGPLRLAVLASGGSSPAADGLRLLDVDAPPGHPTAPPWLGSWRSKAPPARAPGGVR